jgi:hypothetical protein
MAAISGAFITHDASAGQSVEVDYSTGVTAPRSSMIRQDLSTALMVPRSSW